MKLNDGTYILCAVDRVIPYDDDGVATLDHANEPTRVAHSSYWAVLMPLFSLRAESDVE